MTGPGEATPLAARLTELAEARTFVDELSADVTAAEGTLSGGTKLGDGGQALELLRDLTITIGNPRDNLVNLTSDLFSGIGVELTDIWRRQLDSGTAFYYLSLTVSLRCPREVTFQTLECSLDLGPKGPDEPIVQTIFPTSQWRSMLSVDTAVSVALDGSLGWKIGAAVPLPPAGQVRAKADAMANASGVLVAGNYTFQVGHSEIAATGEGNSSCFWRLSDPQLRRVQTVQFALVFKVPAHVSSVTLQALCVAEPKKSWLVQSIRGVWWALSDGVKQMLGSDRADRRAVLVGDHESWELPLPGSAGPT